jgi:hypothetical protein
MKFRSFQKRDIAPKIHTKKRRWLLVIEIFFVVLVAIGSLFSIMRLNDVAFKDTIEDLRERLAPQQEKAKTGDEVTIEGSVREVFHKKPLSITSITKTSDDFITIRTKEKTTVVVSTKQDLEDQAKTLQNVISKAKIEGKGISLVDFRYEKLVVRYKR